MLTALEDRGSYLKGMDAGADDFLTKPLDPVLGGPGGFLKGAVHF